MVKESKINKTSVIIKKLDFSYLPNYAHFLLNHQLKDFSDEFLRISREEKVPVLKYLHNLSEEKLAELSLEGSKMLLMYLAENKTQEYVESSVKKWVTNQLPSIHKEDLISEDVTAISFVRRKTFRTFLSKYTSEFDTSVNIMEEVDRFISLQEKLSFEIIFKLNQQKERDISFQLEHRKEQLTQKNIKLEKMNNELSSFSYVAGHDLKEPLRKIRTYSNFIVEKNGNDIPKEAMEYLQRIINSTANMQKLIDDLLAFSRTTSSEKILKSIDLNELLEELKGSLKDVLDEKNVTILANDLPTIKLIHFQFQQLLGNIIGNAIKYSKPNIAPVITISSSIVLGEQYLNHGADPEKNYHKISISDNGIGFEQEYAEKIFELFQRLHGKDEYTGTGIGLAICKKIAENHNGFMTAEGKEGLGSTFNVFIPTEEIRSFNRIQQ